MGLENEILVKHSSVVITNYMIGNSRQLEDMLSIWDPVYFKMDTLGYFYNEERKELMIPRGIDINFLEKMFRVRAQIIYDHDPFEPTAYHLLMEPKNDIQRKSISFLIGEGDFQYTKKYSQLALDLDTGDGKTYCIIAALTFMKMKSFIITPNDNIKGQWLKAIKKMTDIKDEYVLNIEGSGMIRKLLKMDKIPYKIFIINHRGIHSFAKAEGWDKVTELFQKLKIGIKVYDEAHFEFASMIKTDLHTNTKKTIYLTANFERSGHKENKLFTICFNNVAKFGKETRDEKRKHIVYVVVKYNSKPPLDIQLYVKGKHGFDKNRYIDYQITKDIFYEALMKVCNFVGNKEGKMMLVFSKNDVIDLISDYLLENYESRVPFKYNSTVSQDDKFKALNSELILTTPKSLGTGSDIPGLRFVVNTEQYSSAITANQISGRLREYADDKYTFYFELVDIGFPQVDTMFKARFKVFKKKCVEILDLKLDSK